MDRLADWLDNPLGFEKTGGLSDYECIVFKCLLPLFYYCAVMEDADAKTILALETDEISDIAGTDTASSDTRDIIRDRVREARAKFGDHRDNNRAFKMVFQRFLHAMRKMDTTHCAHVIGKSKRAANKEDSFELLLGRIGN
jgi:hypothetical protein